MPVLRGSITNAVVTIDPGATNEQVTILIKANVAQVRATLDLGTLADNALDTVVRAVAFGSGGSAITVAAVGDSGAAAGVTIDETGSAVTIHYEDGVSTVGDVETAIGSSATLIEVDTAGTGATVLDTADDDFAATALVHTALVLNVAEANGRARHDGTGAPPSCDTIPDQAIDITVDGSGVITAIAFGS